MSKKLYRPKRKKSKEKLSFMDKLEMGSIAIAAAALIGWSGWSAVDALTPDPPVPTYSLYMDGITAFLMTTQGVDPDDQEADVETEGEATRGDDVDVTDAEEAPDEAEASETEEESDENEAETEDESDKQDTETENVKKKIKHVNKKDLVKTVVTPTTSPMLTQAPEPTATPKPTATLKPTATPEPTATPKPKKAKKKSKQTPTETPKTYTATTELNIREAPDKNSKALAMYMPGREITVTEDEKTHDGWLKVNKDGVEGYISSEFVKTE